jgi:hypothetical protein
MNDKNYIPFEEFYNPQPSPVEVEQKSETEILEGVKEILNSNRWRR